MKGSIIETGCALGGSSILIGKLKNKNRKFKVYDSFEMMPEPLENDDEDVHNRYNVIKKGVSKGIHGNKYYGYEKDLYNKVKNSFISFGVDLTNIQLIKGYYEDTLKINNQVALAHIDCDWYDSVLFSLQRIEPYLVVGRFLIIDDYFDDKKSDFNFIQEERLMIERIK